MTQKNQSRYHLVLGIASSSSALLIVLFVLLSGCQTLAADSSPQATPTPFAVPRLLTQVKSEQWGGPGTLGIDERTYFLGERSVFVIDGAVPSVKVPMPDLRTSRGWYLSDIATDPKTGLIYVSDKRGNAIQVISGTNIVTTITGIFEAPLQIVADEDSGEMYVFYTSQRSGSPRSYATVISGTKIIADILLPHFRQIARYNPIDGLIYVGGNTSGVIGTTETVLMVLDNYQVKTLFQPLIEPYSGFSDMAINPHTGDIYMQVGSRIIFWDRKEDLRSISLHREANHRSIGCLAVEPQRGWAYVCSWKERSYALVIDKDELLAEIPIAHWPDSAAVDTAHDYVYIAHYDPTNVSVIRGTELITTLNIIGFGTSEIVVDEERGYFYTMNADDGTISVFGFREETRDASWFGFLPFIQR